MNINSELKTIGDYSLDTRVLIEKDFSFDDISISFDTFQWFIALPLEDRRKILDVIEWIFSTVSSSGHDQISIGEIGDLILDRINNSDGKSKEVLIRLLFSLTPDYTFSGSLVRSDFVKQNFLGKTFGSSVDNIIQLLISTYPLPLSDNLTIATDYVEEYTGGISLREIKNKFGDIDPGYKESGIFDEVVLDKLEEVNAVFQKRLGSTFDFLGTDSIFVSQIKINSKGREISPNAFLYLYPEKLKKNIHVFPISTNLDVSDSAINESTSDIRHVVSGKVHEAIHEIGKVEALPGCKMELVEILTHTATTAVMMEAFGDNDIVSASLREVRRNNDGKIDYIEFMKYLFDFGVVDLDSFYNLVKKQSSEAFLEFFKQKIEGNYDNAILFVNALVASKLIFPLNSAERSSLANKLIDSFEESFVWELEKSYNFFGSSFGDLVTGPEQAAFYHINNAPKYERYIDELAKRYIENGLTLTKSSRMILYDPVTRCFTDEAIQVLKNHLGLSS